MFVCEWHKEKGGEKPFIRMSFADPVAHAVVNMW